MKAFVHLTLWLLVTAGTASADWPQWRGPARDGVVTEFLPLSSSWGNEGPTRIWQSELFPERAGESSVIVSNGRVYLYINWSREEEIETRMLDAQALKKLGWFNENDVPKDLLALIEDARQNRSSRLRGTRLKEWIAAWTEKNVPAEHKKAKRVAENRLKEGKDAISLASLRKIEGIRERVFPNHADFEKWLDDQRIHGSERKKIIGALPTSRSFAEDVVLCVNMTDGKTVWKRTLLGEPNRNMGSSTPVIADGRLYVLGSTHAYALDALSGNPLWQTKLPDGASASSGLVIDQRFIALAGRLTAFDIGTGDIAWIQEEVRGRKSSPTVWQHDGNAYILANADRGKLACVRAATGELLWTAPGGGDSSPVISGNLAILHSNDETLGLVAYQLDAGGTKELWRLPHKGRGASSPIVSGERVYLAGGERMLCADLRTGNVHWSERMRAEISSPILADGKLFVLEGRGANLLMVDASPSDFRQLAKMRVRAARCPSPAFSGGRLLLRQKDHVACFDLRASATKSEDGSGEGE